MRISLLLIPTVVAMYHHNNRVQNPVTHPKNTPSFSIDYDNNRFMLDGEPFQYISGSIHYFRIHPAQWKDRLKKVRAMGFNAIQYYIPWNFHETRKGEYNFEGIRDFVRFSEIAAEVGLFTLLRIGPYVCGEWENGGLPYWLLLKGEDIKMRSADKRYLEEVDTWFSVLLPKVRPMLRQNGGPVLMVQIENEYGSYDACSVDYMAWLRDVTRKALGEQTVLYTTDGNGDHYLKCGSVPGVLPTVDFGVQSDRAVNASFDVQRKYLPKGKGPLVNSEFYPGWLVLWGQTSQELPTTEAIISTASSMYSIGANINFYMIHGGTNFGWWNGAEPVAPCITSYDYTAPISEAGDVTKNYLAIRKWIKGLKDWKWKPQAVPANTKKLAAGKITLHQIDSLPNAMRDGCISSKYPQSFEKIGQPMGLMLYETSLQHCGKNLSIPTLKDFGFTYVDEKPTTVFVNRYYNNTMRETILEKCSEGSTLSILVENQGRQTYETINDYKGISSPVYLDGAELTEWTICTPEMPDMLNGKDAKPTKDGDAGVYSGFFDVKEPRDTFIDTTGWGKGVLFVNGHNLGRYWPSQGPQMTLFVPAPYLKAGSNELALVELQGAECVRGCTMTSRKDPVFKFDAPSRFYEREELDGRRKR